jgi:G3E family GTPase
MIAETAASAAPRAEIVAARFGDNDESIIQRFTPATTLKRLVSVPAAGGKVFDLTAHIHHAGENHGRDHRPGVSSHAGEPHEHDLPHERLGLTSWSAPMPANCNAEGLASLLQLVLDGLFGQVERVKGVARAGAGWVRFDVAGGRTSMAAFAAGKDEAGRVVAIGRHVDEERLRAAFEACAIEEAAA